MSDGGWKAGIKEALFGAVLGIDAIGLCVALATLCFAGPLVAGLGLATAAFLASSAFLALVLMRFSAFANALATTQDTSIAILAPAAAVAAAGAVGGEAAKVATAFAVIGSAAFLSGLAFVGVGWLGLGRVVRLVPYPVAAGFLASSGWLLVLSAFMILTHTNSLQDLVSTLADSQAIAATLPAIGLALGLIAAVHFKGGSTGFVLVILLAIAVFYAVVSLSGMGIVGAQNAGLLQKITAYDGSALQPLSLYSQIDWSRVLSVAPVLAAVVVINLIGVLLNISGVELAARRDIDVNRELRVTGLANLVVGAYGGATSFMTSGSTAVAQKVAPASRSLTLSYALVGIIGCFFATQIVSYVPVFVAAGLLIFIGLSMLADWLVATRQKLVLQDWLIIVGILAVTIVVGILPAIAFGLGLAILSFAVGYARLPVIRFATNGTARRSSLDRPPEEDVVLTKSGGSIRIVHLQGFLFFGSVERLIDGLRNAMVASRETSEGRGALILDFAAVTGLDSAGCAALGKLGYVAHNSGVGVHLAAMPDDVMQTVKRWQLDFSDASGLHLWPSVDAALEACETALINHQLGPDRQVSVRTLFQTLGGGHTRTDELLGLMEPVELAAGDLLIKQGTRSGDIYVLESGRLAVLITGLHGKQIRIRSLAPGSVVGEVAHYRDRLRSADVTAETPSRVYRLSESVFDRIEKKDRDMAALVHSILAHALAEKVVQTTRLVSHA